MPETKEHRDIRWNYFDSDDRLVNQASLLLRLFKISEKDSRIFFLNLSEIPEETLRVLYANADGFKTSSIAYSQFNRVVMRFKDDSVIYINLYK